MYSTQYLINANSIYLYVYIYYIIGVGERLKQQAEIKLNNEHDKALQRKVEQLLEEKNKVLNEKIRPVERAKYEKNLAVVVDEFNNFKFAVTQSISII